MLDWEWSTITIECTFSKFNLEELSKCTVIYPGEEPEVKKYWATVATNSNKYIAVYLDNREKRKERKVKEIIPSAKNNIKKIIWLAKRISEYE